MALIASYSAYKPFPASKQKYKQQLKTIDELLIYYWSSAADAELDFLIQQDDRIILVEVKTEENLRVRSLKRFVD